VSDTNPVGIGLVFGFESAKIRVPPNKKAERPPMYCITRTDKIKDRNQINAAALHNFRLKFQPNVDPTKTPENQILINTLEVDPTRISSLQEKLSAYYKGLGIKERKDNVLMMEFIATASPEFFEGKSKKEIKEWADHQVEFYKTGFGDQVKLVILHLDEKSPHLHVMIGTEQKTTKRYKNQKGEFFKETWSLNAKRYNPAFLREYHTQFANWNAKYDLKRGKSRKISDPAVTHTSPKDYHYMIENEMETINKHKSDSEKWQNFQKNLYPKIKEQITNLMDGLELLMDIVKTKDLSTDEQFCLDIIEKQMPKKTPRTASPTPLKRR
jgi:hypothetical protein